MIFLTLNNDMKFSMIDVFNDSDIAIIDMIAMMVMMIMLIVVMIVKIVMIVKMTIQEQNPAHVRKNNQII